MRTASADVPVFLWVAVGLLVLAGLFVVLPALQALPDALDLLDQGSFGRTFGLFILVMLLLLISFGSTCFYLAVKLLQADRAGRILTIILAASLGFGLLLGDNHGTTEIMAILGCVGVIGILWLIEEVTLFFTGPNAAQGQIATSVVAARSHRGCAELGTRRNRLCLPPSRRPSGSFRGCRLGDAGGRRSGFQILGPVDFCR